MDERESFFDPKSEQTPPRKLVVWGVPILALLIGLGLTFGPMLAKGPQQLPGDLGDTRLVHFCLEHGHQFLLQAEAHRQFWDPPIFYPARNVAAYTDTLLSLLPYYSPWRLLGATPETAFQLWWLSIFGLNFAAFFVYLRRIFDLSRLAASAGAYLFSFGSSRLVDLVHPQMMPWFYVIAALYALHRLWQALEHGDRPFAPWLALLCVSLTLQAYAAVYPLFFLGLGVLCFGLPAFAWSILYRPARQRLVQRIRRLLNRSPSPKGAAWIVGATLALLAVTPLAEQYLGTRQSLGERPWKAISPRLPRLSSWVLMGPGNRLYGGLSDAKAKSSPRWQARSSNHSNGLGFVTLGMVTLGIAVAGRRRRHVVPLLIGSSVLAMLTTVYPGGFTPWLWLYEHLPGAGAIRAVGRVGMVLLIPAGIALGLLVERLAGDRRLRWGLPLVLVLVVAEQAHTLPSFDSRPTYGWINQVAVDMPTDCPAFLLSPAIPGRGPGIQETAMWLALASGVPTVNGRYGNHPPGWRLIEIAKHGGLPSDEIERRLNAWLDEQGMPHDSVCRLEVRAGETRLRRLTAAVPEVVGSE